MKSITIKTILIISIFALVSCSTNKNLISISDTKGCLRMEPITIEHVNFSPKWITGNGVKKVIVKKYLSETDEKVNSTSVIHFNSNGYEQKIEFWGNYSGKEKDLDSRFDYEYENLDSFLIQKTQLIQFHNSKGEIEFDTLNFPEKIFNLSSAKFLKNKNNETSRSYEYDDKDRLTKIINEKGTVLYEFDYFKRQAIKMKRIKTFGLRNRNHIYENILLKFDKNGQLIEVNNESENLKHQFFYNVNGEIIETKTIIKDEETKRFYFQNNIPVKLIYEYIK